MECWKLLYWNNGEVEDNIGRLEDITALDGNIIGRKEDKRTRRSQKSTRSKRGANRSREDKEVGLVNYC